MQNTTCGVKQQTHQLVFVIPAENAISQFCSCASGTFDAAGATAQREPQTAEVSVCPCFSVDIIHHQTVSQKGETNRGPRVCKSVWSK